MNLSVLAKQALERKYFKKEGFRLVYPYHCKIETFSKGTWIGKTLRDAFTHHFGTAEGYWDKRVLRGDVHINERRDPGILDHVIDGRDFIGHRFHQHERAVCDKPVKILMQTPDFVVLDKPSSIPVHPVMSYNYNSLVEIAKWELGFPQIFNCHRIDRLTSGIVISGTTSDNARRVAMKMANSDSVIKEYLARVVGRFPDEITCEAPLFFNKTARPRLLTRVDPAGRPAKTIFTRLDYDPKTDSSIVRCVPVTGRTHQIRVHLAHLDHPIINDPLYNTVHEAYWYRGDLWEKSPRVHMSDGIEELLEEDCQECEEKTVRILKEEMYLHSFRFKLEGEFEIQTETPEWAKS